MILSLLEGRTRTLFTIKKTIKRWFKTMEKAVAFLVVSGFVFSVTPLVNAEMYHPVTVDTSRVDFVKNQIDPLSYKTEPIAFALAESRHDEKQRILAEEMARSKSRTIVSRSKPGRLEDVSTEAKHELARRAAEAVGIPEYWQYVAAVWQVESGKRMYTAVRSSAGAQGPMQFMAGTWRKYAMDGNGDGVADVHDATDAVYAGAKLLAEAGMKHGDVDRALFAYNHAGWYVTKVKQIAQQI